MSKKNNIDTTDEVKDTGFSAVSTPINQRYINEDGSFNVKVAGRPWLRSYDVYHRLIAMSWFRFNLLVLLVYSIINLIFACLYYLIGVQYLAGATTSNKEHEFMDAFFFSAQTLTTVGYGRISPVGFMDSSVAAIESLVGLLGFALATGLFYGRFSRPVAKIARSKVALIAPYRFTGRAFMFRIANQRINNLIGAEVVLNLSLTQEDEGKPVRKFYSLDLEIKKIEMFPLSWTVVHPINEDSPIYNYTKEDLVAASAEFLISFKAYDESFSQNVVTRFSYKPDEMIWGAKFIRNFEANPGGYTLHHLDRISEYEPAELPTVATTADIQT